MKGSAAGDLKAVLGEIGGRLEQAAQSVAAMGQMVAVLAEGLEGTDAERLVQAATTRLIGLALGEAAVPGGVRRTSDRSGDAPHDRKSIPGVGRAGDRGREQTSIQRRILEGLPMVVVEVGTVRAEGDDHLMAIGVEATGVKRVLGIQPGSGANRDAVAGLVVDLYRRGLHAANGTRLLLITEGTDAEDLAFLERWPQSMRVAHCQKAVTEKVLAHLGSDSQENVRKELREAFNIPDAARALVRLEAVEQRLRSRSPGAATSLSRHAAASLTVKHLCGGSVLERTISTLGVLRTAVEQARLWGRNAVADDGAAGPLYEGAALWEQRTRRVIGHEDMSRLALALAQAQERTA